MYINSNSKLFLWRHFSDIMYTLNNTNIVLLSVSEYKINSLAV